MISLILALILGCVYLYLRHKDPRMLRNGIVLVAAGWFALVGISEILANWFPWTQWIAFAIIAASPLAILVLAGFLISNGATMMRNEGRSLGNLLSLVAGVALVGLPVFAVLLVITLNPVAIGLAALLFFLCSYFGVVFVVFLAYAVAYGRMKHTLKPVAVVILGSQIINGKVPPLLRSRLDKGLEIYQEAAPENSPLLIPSGGQGADESHPEGVAMAEYLVAAGAPEQHVVAEDQAVNTAQNLRFSAAVAKEQGREGEMVVVTNNYHVLRAALLSRKLGIDAQVVGSPTARYFLPSAFLREFVAILKEHKILHALMCIPFVALTAVLTFAVIQASQ
ncbi:YdcF family protein [Arthrobacter psychrolactophilus]|uniref:YdcF family protein n=1 Tax=Arthrobacter psychrolactophilus TaxID=92442 RepID=A0A2V5IQM0_9MICC|nr:YdcF family protein [Arthrobacter psychrolactophilus]PYI37682.1 YdcF family protein [Arthrobacter psychrolactophilus]